METTIKDSIFGEMKYNHRWYKHQKYIFLGKEWDIIVAAKAYSGKPITEEQRKSYSNFRENEIALLNKVGEKLKDYVNENLQELRVYWVGAKTVNTFDELAQIVTPKTLLVKQDGTTIMLLDCIWDEENGIAAKVLPEVTVGNQDMFL